MKINHTVMNYAVGAAALALSATATLADHKPPVVVQPGVYATATASRFDWKPLGQDKTIDLGESLHGVSPGKVTLFCSHASCQALRRDLDDAFQIAEWQSSFEDREVDSENDVGLFVGPPGLEAEILAAALEKHTGLRARIVPIQDYGAHGEIKDIAGVGIIIGKVGK